MDQFTYHFPGITETVSTVHAQNNTLASLRDEYSASMNRLAGVWGGVGNEAFTAKQTNTINAFNELIAACQDLNNKLEEAGVHMAASDRAVGSTFGGVV